MDRRPADLFKRRLRLTVIQQETSKDRTSDDVSDLPVPPVDALLCEARLNDTTAFRCCLVYVLTSCRSSVPHTSWILDDTLQ